MILVTRPTPFCYHLKSLTFFKDPSLLEQPITFAPLLKACYHPAPDFKGIVVITSGQALFSCEHLTDNVLWCIGEDVAKMASKFKKVFWAHNVQDLFAKLCQSYPQNTSFLYVHGDRISWPLAKYLRQKGFNVYASQGYSLEPIPLRFTPPSTGLIYVTCYSQRLAELFLQENLSWQDRAIALCLSSRIAKVLGANWHSILIK